MNSFDLIKSSRRQHSQDSSSRLLARGSLISRSITDSARLGIVNAFWISNIPDTDDERIGISQESSLDSYHGASAMKTSFAGSILSFSVSTSTSPSAVSTLFNSSTMRRTTSRITSSSEVLPLSDISCSTCFQSSTVGFSFLPRAS